LGSHREEDSPRIDQGRSENTCNAYNAYNALHQEKRDNHCVRLRPSIHKAVKGYCGIAQLNIGEFYERAALLFMDLNPVNWVVLNVEMPQTRERESSLDDRVQELICIERVDKFVKNLKQLRSKGVERFHITKKEEFLKILKECRKVKNRSDELDELIQEAVSFFEQPNI